MTLLSSDIFRQLIFLSIAVIATHYVTAAIALRVTRDDASNQEQKGQETILCDVRCQQIKDKLRVRVEQETKQLRDLKDAEFNADIKAAEMENDRIALEAAKREQEVLQQRIDALEQIRNKSSPDLINLRNSLAEMERRNESTNRQAAELVAKQKEWSSKLEEIIQLRAATQKVCQENTAAEVEALNREIFKCNQLAPALDCEKAMVEAQSRIAAAAFILEQRKRSVQHFKEGYMTSDDVLEQTDILGDPEKNNAYWCALEQDSGNLVAYYRGDNGLSVRVGYAFPYWVNTFRNNRLKQFRVLANANLRIEYKQKPHDVVAELRVESTGTFTRLVLDSEFGFLKILQSRTNSETQLTTLITFPLVIVPNATFRDGGAYAENENPVNGGVWLFEHPLQHPNVWVRRQYENSAMAKDVQGLPRAIFQQLPVGQIVQNNDWFNYEGQVFRCESKAFKMKTGLKYIYTRSAASVETWGGPLPAQNCNLYYGYGTGGTLS